MDQAAPQKPTPITVIGVLIILLAVFSAIGAVSLLALQDDPAVADALKASAFSLETLIAISTAGAAIMAISGIGVLMGANWGRWLYLLYGIASIVIGALSSPSILQVLPSVAILAVFSYFLFNAAASAYFSRARS